MKFTKMEGLGNDYVYVNGFETDVTERVVEGLADAGVKPPAVLHRSC